MKTKKKLFIGDKVFDIRYGWGRVINRIVEIPKTILYVLFDTDKLVLYTEDDKNFIEDYSPTLSHTEYSIHTTQSKYPKIMEVSDCGKKWLKRVVFMEKGGRFIAWSGAETFEEAEDVTSPYDWEYAREVQEPREISIQEIANKFGIPVEELRIKE